MITPATPLHWIANDRTGAAFAFGDEPPHTYQGAPISADFDLTLENLAPYTTAVLDQAAPLEGAGLFVKLVEIKNGKVKVW
jgi:hypothetical protein